MENVDVRCGGGARSWNPDADITVWIGIALEGNLIAQNQATGYQPSVVTNVWVATVGYDRPLECGVYASGAQAIAQGTFWANCGDPNPTIMRQEYKQFSVQWMPSCSDFEHFSDPKFARPEDTHSNWGIFRGFMYAKLGWITEHAAMGDIDITSGYRCPHKNDQIPGAAAQSRHLFGDAMDMKPPASYYTPPNEPNFNILRDATVGADPSYLTSWSTYADRHLHADWR